MPGPKDIERLRRLTPAQRTRLWIESTRLAWRVLRHLLVAERQRRLDLERAPWNLPPPRRRVG